VQYPGLQGAGALGDASAPCTPAGSMAASTHGGTYRHVAEAGGAWSGETGAAAPIAAAAPRRRGATPTSGVVTPPRSAPVRGGRAGQHGARAGGWIDRRATGRLNRTGRWRQQPPTRRRDRSRRAGTITRWSSWALRTPEVAARGRRAQLGAAGEGRGAGAVRVQRPLWQDSPSDPRNSIRFWRHRDLSDADTPSDPGGHECRLPPLKRRASPLL